jgi:acyl carrier protein
MRSTLSIVHVLARRLGRPPSTIHPRHDLVRDLGVTAVDLVLVALDIEKVVGIDIDVEGLDAVRTVSQLERFFAAAVARASETRVCLDVA